MSDRESKRNGAPAGFWALPAKGVDKSQRVHWDRLVDQVRESDAWTLYRALEEGVPTSIVMLAAEALTMPVSHVLSLLDLSATGYRRRAAAGRVLPELAGHRALALLRLVAKLRRLLAESGDPILGKDFDLESWLRSWIQEPMAALGGETPAALLRNPEGQRVVEILLERMRHGSVA